MASVMKRLRPEDYEDDAPTAPLTAKVAKLRMRPLGPSGLAHLRTIVTDKQAARVNGVMVDLFSASAVVQVHDAVNQTAQAKLLGMCVTQAVDTAFRVINKVSQAS